MRFCLAAIFAAVTLLFAQGGTAENFTPFVLSLPEATAPFDSSDYGFIVNNGSPNKTRIDQFVTTNDKRIPAVSATSLGITAGSSDNTAALQAALDTGLYKHIVFPANGQPYKQEQVTVNSPVHIEVKTGATVMLHHASATDVTMFAFNNGSEGSVFDGGGTCDGNRDALAGSAPNPAAGWTCFAIQNTRITVRDIFLQNFIREAFKTSDCDEGAVIGPLTIKDSGLAVFAYPCPNSTWDVNAINIGATGGVHMYEHPFQFYGMARSHGRLVLKGWTSDLNNLDPIPVGINLGADGPGNDWSIDVSGFSGVAADGTNYSVGVKTVGGFASHYNITATDSIQNIILSGLMESSVDCFSDGKYLVHPTKATIPISIQHGLHQYTNVASSSYDTHALLGPRNNQIRCRGIRGDYNELESGENNDLHLIAEGNRAFGLKVDCTSTNEVFVPPLQCSDNNTLHLKARNNGDAGLYISGARRLTVASDSDFLNNGQLGAGALGSLWRTGIYADDTQAPIDSFVIDGYLKARDTQSFTNTDALSFLPGTSDANNQYVITTANPDKLGLGQYIVLKNATGAGDVTGKIVDIHMVTGKVTNSGIVALNYPVDTITVETTTPVTYSETGNLTALTGTASSSGQTVTLTGGSATTEVTGHMWLKSSDGQYRRVARVPSNTTIMTDTPFSPALSGATLQKITIDVQGVPSQNYGLTLQNTAAAGSIRVGGFDTKGVLVDPYYLNGNGIRVGDSVLIRGSSAATALPAGSTMYVGIGTASSVSSDNAMYTDTTGKMRDLLCKSLFAPGAGQSIVCKIFKNGAATSLTCTIADTNTSCEDKSHLVTWTAGDMMTVQYVTSAGAAGANRGHFLVTIDPTQ